MGQEQTGKRIEPEEVSNLDLILQIRRLKLENYNLKEEVSKLKQQIYDEGGAPL